MAKIIIFTLLSFQLMASSKDNLDCLQQGLMNLVFEPNKQSKLAANKTPQSSQDRKLIRDIRAKELARTLHFEYSGFSKKVVSFLNDTFGENVDEISTRVKSRQSIKAKLIKKDADGENVKALNEARSSITDGVGAKVLLDNPDPEQISAYINKFLRQSESRGFELQEILNYHGSLGGAYLRSKDLKKIQKYYDKKDSSPIIINKKKSIGYTSIHIILKDKVSGNSFELQIRGTQMDHVARIEHFIYDLKQGKDLPSHLKTPELKEIEEVFSKLDDKQKEIYKDYLTSHYEHARLEEVLNSDFPIPTFPKELHEFDSLRFDNIESLILAATQK